MHRLLVLQVPSTWVCSLPHQQTDRVQLCHPILQAGSDVEGGVSIVSLKTKKQNDTVRKGKLCKRSSELEGGKVIPAPAELRLSKITFAFTKDRQLGNSKKRRMSSRFASSAAKCRAVRPLLRSL